MKEWEWEEGVREGPHLEGDGLGLAWPQGGSGWGGEGAGKLAWPGRRWEVEELLLLVAPLPRGPGPRHGAVPKRTCL